MVTFAALSIVALVAAVVLVLAGREFLRVNGFPPHRVHRVGDLAHLASLGYSALNDASNRAARSRVTGPC